MNGESAVHQNAGVSCAKLQRNSVLVIIKFGSNVRTLTIKWIIEKIRSIQTISGQMLCADIAPNNVKEDEMILYVSATMEHLLIASELMQLKKRYKDNSLREISMADIGDFNGTDDIESFLTVAEKQKIIMHELESIRASATEIPGLLHKVELHEGEAIIPRCLKEKIISLIFPLHQDDKLNELGTAWYSWLKLFSRQPLGLIQQYFGETIALYFAFLGLYTAFLIPPAALGLLFSLLSPFPSLSLRLIFCIFNIIWTTLFLEAWKRRSAVLTHRWGTSDVPLSEKPRAAYRGPIGRDEVTGRLEPQYPEWRRALKLCWVSTPAVLVCLGLASIVMLGYFRLQAAADMAYSDPADWFAKAGLLYPTALYAATIVVMNAGYRLLAKALTDWENHRLQSSYDNHLIVKLVLFDFMNCFMSLFYVAFYLQDMDLLCRHLGTLLITLQIIGQLQESLFPYLSFCWRSRRIEGKIDTVLRQAKVEATMDFYEGTLDDYLEMFLQFGYVFLFSAVFPTAAFWALLNNITEIRTDAFKLCRIFQRPFSRPTSSIGAWQVAFEVMSVVAVITNCALIAISPDVWDYAIFQRDTLSVVLYFVAAEHVLIVLKVGLAYVIPDAPSWIIKATAKMEYDSRQAWKQERIRNSSHHFRRFSQLPSLPTKKIA